MQATIDALRERVAGLEAKAARLDGTVVVKLAHGYENGWADTVIEVCCDIDDYANVLALCKSQRVALVPVEEGDAR